MKDVCIKDLGSIFFLVGKSVITAGILGIFLLSIKGILSDYPKLKVDAQSARLDRIQPYYEYLFKNDENPSLWDKREIQEFVIFYKQVCRYMSDNAEAYGMLGFFYHFLNQDSKAIEFYKKSIELKPKFFWFHYDLGVLYLQKGSFAQAERKQ